MHLTVNCNVCIQNMIPKKTEIMSLKSQCHLSDNISVKHKLSKHILNTRMHFRRMHTARGSGCHRGVCRGCTHTHRHHPHTCPHPLIHSSSLSTSSCSHPIPHNLYTTHPPPCSGACLDRPPGAWWDTHPPAQVHAGINPPEDRQTLVKTLPLRAVTSRKFTARCI